MYHNSGLDILVIRSVILSFDFVLNMSQGICKDLSFSVVQKSNVHNYSDTKNIDCFGLAVFVVDFIVSVYTCEPGMLDLTWVGDSCF